MAPGSMWCIAGPPHLLAPPLFPDLRHVASSKHQPVFLASSNSCALWVSPFLDHEQHDIRDTVPFVFAFTISAYQGVWHLMGSDGCFLIGLMKDRRNEQTVITQLCQFIEKCSLPCTETLHRHTLSLLLTLHLSSWVRLGMGCGEGHFIFIKMHSWPTLCSLGGSSQQPQSDVHCGWAQGTDTWTSESVSKAQLPHPFLYSLTTLSTKKKFF